MSVSDKHVSSDILMEEGASSHESDVAASGIVISGQRAWNVRDTLDWTVGYLTSKGDEHPRRSAEWLISAATGLSRVECYAYFDRLLSLEERTVLREGIRRRATGEPLQYVTGEVAFRHIVVRCGEGVLIPRPETEILVESVLPAIDAAIATRGMARVLDLCTGTGCIALSIAQERPEAHLVATDLSPAAVALAKRNREALRLEERVSLLECDLATKVDSADRGLFDVVISNPPYIPTAELVQLPGEVVCFEPTLALDGGLDGLDIYRRILDCSWSLAPSKVSAPPLLRPGGLLACELHEHTLQVAAHMARDAGYADVVVCPDLTGRERIVCASAPCEI